MVDPKQMLWNIFSPSPAKYTRASEHLFSSVIITVILSCAIIRIYTILDIYLQVSKTEGLAELHWVIKLGVLIREN